MKLGKLAKKQDSRTLKLSNYIDINKLPPAPKAFGYLEGTKDWGMLANDSIGDCTCAAVCHLAMLWVRSNGGTLTFTDQDAITTYSAITGYDPKTGLNDNGAILLDVLNYLRKSGVAGHKIEAFTEIDITNIEEVKLAIYIFGGIDIGVQLPKSAETATTMWTVVPGDEVVGGHSIIVTGYDDKFIRIVSWGQEYLATWEFFTTYCDEAYAMISTDFIKNNLAPTGMNIANLIADLKTVTKK